MSPASDDQTWVQPRRRPNAVPSLSSPVEASSESPHASTSKSSPKMRLIKGETFHSPSSPPSEDRDPVLSFRSLPHRSPTCPKDLDAIAAGEQRMADILGRLSLNSDDPVKSKPSLRVDDDLPVPSGILQAHMQVAPVTGEPPSSSDSSPRPLHKRSSLSTESSSPLHHSHSHSSDSGLGTSISSQSSISSDKNKGMSYTLLVFFYPVLTSL